MAINKTIEQIREEVLRIKNETVAKANTATRVGGALEDIVDHIEKAVEGVLDDVQDVVDGVQSSLSSEVSRAQAKEAELQEAVDGLKILVEGDTKSYSTIYPQRYPFAFQAGNTYVVRNLTPSSFVTIKTATAATGGTTTTLGSVQAGGTREFTIEDSAPYLVVDTVDHTIENTIEIALVDTLLNKIERNANAIAQEITDRQDAINGIDAQIDEKIEEVIETIPRVVKPKDIYKDEEIDREKTYLNYLSETDNSKISGYDMTTKKLTIVAYSGSLSVQKYSTTGLDKIQFDLLAEGYESAIIGFENSDKFLDYYSLAKIYQQSFINISADNVVTIDLAAYRASGTATSQYNRNTVAYFYLQNTKGVKAYVSVETATTYTLKDFKWLKPDIPEINLPAKIIAVKGRELNIYKDNLFPYIKTEDICLLDSDLTQSESSDNYETKKRVRLTPSGVQTATKKFELYKNDLSTVDATFPFSYVVKDDSTLANKSIRFMIIGDSKTDGGWLSKIIYDNATAKGATVVSLGTRQNVLAPNVTTYNHEGRSGWSAKDYLTKESYNGATNAFLFNGEFNFASYMTAQGYSGVDVVFIMLGTNDEGQGYASEYCDNVSTMIESIRAYNSNVKVVVGVTEPCYEGEVGRHYWRAVNIKALDSLILQEFDNREAEGIYVCPIYLSYDTVNDFVTTEVPLSYADEFRGNTKKDIIVDSALRQLHQGSVGYVKNAECMYATLVYVLQ